VVSHSKLALYSQ
jgi:hypothetical protein